MASGRRLKFQEERIASRVQFLAGDFPDSSVVFLQNAKYSASPTAFRLRGGRLYRKRKKNSLPEAGIAVHHSILRILST